MQTNNLKNNTTCERCKKLFVCNAIDISNCDCTKIKLTQNEIENLKQTYANCLCNNCLIELKKDELI